MSVMDEPCGGGKLGLLLCLVILSAFFARRTYAVGVPLRRTGGALLLKRDITPSSLQRAAALVGRRVALELV
jgi:hypothetical protein